MDQETVLQQFENLSQKIENLIEACERYKAENLELRRNNETLTVQLQEKEASEKRSDELKALVRSKIDSLMGRLSQFTEE